MLNKPSSSVTSSEKQYLQNKYYGLVNESMQLKVRRVVTTGAESVGSDRKQVSGGSGLVWICSVCEYSSTYTL